MIITEKGGNPNIDGVLMIKILVLQQWYFLSDQATERGMAIDFLSHEVSGLSWTIPDSTNMWLFRERLIEKENSNPFGKSFEDNWMLKDWSLRKIHPGCYFHNIRSRQFRIVR